MCETHGRVVGAGPRRPNENRVARVSSEPPPRRAPPAERTAPQQPAPADVPPPPLSQQPAPGGPDVLSAEPADRERRTAPTALSSGAAGGRGVQSGRGGQPAFWWPPAPELWLRPHRVPTTMRWGWPCSAAGLFLANPKHPSFALWVGHGSVLRVGISRLKCLMVFRMVRCVRVRKMVGSYDRSDFNHMVSWRAGDEAEPTTPQITALTHAHRCQPLTITPGEALGRLAPQ